MSHAFGSLFPNASLRFKQSDLEHLLWTECSVKPTSVLKNHLLLVSLPDFCTLQQKWLRDVPDLDDEDWKHVWDLPFRYLVSLGDRLIQFQIVHRTYFTPYRLHRMNPSASQECWWHDHSPGDFSHIFRGCPAIAKHWKKVISIGQHNC